VTGGDWIKKSKTADTYGSLFGRDAIDGAISFIKSKKSMEGLTWSDGLALVARK